VKLDHATVLPSPKFDNPDRLGYTPNTPRETGGGGAHRCLLSFLFALSSLSTGCTPQQVFEPSRKLSNVMKLAENCLKVGLSDLLGCSFQLSGRLLAKI
jgi:hypothetical protein